MCCGIRITLSSVVFAHSSSQCTDVIFIILHSHLKFLFLDVDATKNPLRTSHCISRCDYRQRIFIVYPITYMKKSLSYIPTLGKKFIHTLA